MKKNSPGCATTDCCGPCCAGVWALVRAMYSHFKHTYSGNDVTLLSPSPYVTEFDLLESIVVSGVTQYFCNASGGGNETLINTPDWYGPTANPRIIGQQGIIDPGTGLYPYSYGLGSGGLQANVFVCDPPQIYALVQVTYDVYQTADPTGAFLTAGLTLDIGTGNYQKIDGDYSHTVDPRPGNVYRIYSKYEKTFTGATQIATIPATIDVVPPWNPFGKSSKLELS